jgi:hypothetical protein
MVAFRGKGHDRSYGLGRVDEVERGAEEARERIRERQPSRECPAEVSGCSDLHTLDILVLTISLYPRPELHAGASFSCSIPRALSPALGVPPPHAKPQVEFFRVRMLQNLPKRPREVAEVLLLKVRLAFVTGEVERRKKRALGEWSQKESLMVVGAGCDTCYAGIEEQYEERRQHFSIASPGTGELAAS